MGSAHLLQWLVIRHFQRAVTVVLVYSFFGEGFPGFAQTFGSIFPLGNPLLGESIQDWGIFQGTDAFSDRPVLSLRGPGERGIVQSGGLFVRWKPQGFRGRIPWGGSLRVSIVRETPVAVPHSCDSDTWVRPN